MKEINNLTFHLFNEVKPNEKVYVNRKGHVYPFDYSRTPNELKSVNNLSTILDNIVYRRRMQFDIIPHEIQKRVKDIRYAHPDVVTREFVEEIIRSVKS